MKLTISLRFLSDILTISYSSQDSYSLTFWMKPDEKIIKFVSEEDPTLGIHQFQLTGTFVSSIFIEISIQFRLLHN